MIMIRIGLIYCVKKHKSLNQIKEGVRHKIECLVPYECVCVLVTSAMGIEN